MLNFNKELEFVCTNDNLEDVMTEIKQSGYEGEFTITVSGEATNIDVTPQIDAEPELKNESEADVYGNVAKTETKTSQSEDPNNIKINIDCAKWVNTGEAPKVRYDDKTKLSTLFVRYVDCDIVNNNKPVRSTVLKYENLTDDQVKQIKNLNGRHFMMNNLELKKSHSGLPEPRHIPEHEYVYAQCSRKHVDIKIYIDLGFPEDECSVDSIGYLLQ